MAMPVVGDETTSSWVTVSQEIINAFADATNDHNYIHVDIEKAAKSPLGGTIAHGLLTLSLVPALAYEALPEKFKMSVNYGYDKIRFLTPVHSGKRIRARFKILAVTEIRPNEWRRLVGLTVEIENETRPALVAEWLTLHYV